MRGFVMLPAKQGEQAHNPSVDQCITQARGYAPLPCVGMDPCVNTEVETRAFSNSGVEKDPRWLYVGENRSDGLASGRHGSVDEKEGRSLLGDCHCDRRERCLYCLFFFLVLMCSGLLAAYMALNSSNPPSMSGAPARSAASPSAVVDSMSAEPYDCVDQYHDWESLWSDNKMAWCCKHEQKGCTKATTSAAAPHVTSLSTADALRRPTSAACMASCTFDSQTATCGQRVQFAAEYVFFAEADPCNEAHNMVLKECGSCSGCMLDATGCDSATA